MGEISWAERIGVGGGAWAGAGFYGGGFSLESGVAWSRAFIASGLGGADFCDGKSVGDDRPSDCVFAGEGWGNDLEESVSDRGVSDPRGQ